MQDPRWSDSVASAPEIADILDRVRAGLDQGGLGIGFPNAYAPGSGVKEMSELCSLAAGQNAPTFTHIAYMANTDPRSSVEAYTRLIGYAGSTGAHMHICHFNSTSLQDVERAAQLVRTAQAQGLKVTVEAYPYGTGSTVVGATFFGDPDFPQRTGGGYDSVEMVSTGSASLHRAGRSAGGAEGRSGGAGAVALPGCGGEPAGIAICWMCRCCSPAGPSRPMPCRGRSRARSIMGRRGRCRRGAVSHPRSAGTFTRFLREWVRERGTLPLIDGLAKCTLIPAQIMQASTPQFAQKGRIQVGCDADLVAFDLASLTDRADFKQMNRAAEGMRHVLVGGQSVITDGVLDLAARPGRAVRRPVVG